MNYARSAKWFADIRNNLGSGPINPTLLPDMAPELYQKRNDRSEAPHEFTLRVYHK